MTIYVNESWRLSAHEWATITEEEIQRRVDERRLVDPEYDALMSILDARKQFYAENAAAREPKAE